MRYILSIFGLLFSLAACAEEAPSVPSTSEVAKEYIEGKDYLVMATPVATITGDKIEVTEIFRYGCVHCYHFDLILEPWEKSLPSDVEFVRTPVVWNKDSAIRARVYFTAKALGVGQEVHKKLFETMHVEGNHKALLKEDDIAAMFESLGVSRDKFSKMFNNFLVTSKVNQADARARSFTVEGTPELFVNGKYRITAGTAGTQKGMVEVADYLIAKIRAEKSK